jgi:hypothetical protein
MPKPTIHETLAAAAKHGIVYEYGGPHSKPGEPFAAIDTTTGHVWTRDRGEGILGLIRNLTKLKAKGKPIPIDCNTEV